MISSRIFIFSAFVLLLIGITSANHVEDNCNRPGFCETLRCTQQKESDCKPGQVLIKSGTCNCCSVCASPNKPTDPIKPDCSNTDVCKYLYCTQQKQSDCAPGQTLQHLGTCGCCTVCG